MKIKTSGYVMTIVGSILIMANALDYIFGWDIVSTAIGIIGLVFITLGIKITKRQPA